MSRRDWLKVALLILIPLNTWFGVLYYLHWLKQKPREKAFIQSIRDEARIVASFRQKQLGVEVGRKLNYPFPFPFKVIGRQPPFGQGYPVLFINTSWSLPVFSEVWEPVISEALNASPYLHVVLLYNLSSATPKEYAEGYYRVIAEIMKKFNTPRLSIIVNEKTDWIISVFGRERGGCLLVLCDGQGIVRHVEPYPSLKISPYPEEEIADWKPKLRQAVKKVLDKFFGESSVKEGE